MQQEQLICKQQSKKKKKKAGGRQTIFMFSKPLTPNHLQSYLSGTGAEREKTSVTVTEADGFMLLYVNITSWSIGDDTDK